MTWGEFKAFVEANGVRDDLKINYIDIYPNDGSDINVMVKRLPSGELYLTVN